ncbi:hypothetical protein SAMN06265360_12045 [Haloechinothrix alba]|uniref:Uncharacterized protein n=1 Tax=Haloechinothrix alba TaxID=664784 RepID=A0A238ZCB2_9PSEU|nr:hypothetical protein [Haloechinothrix alba]SNR80403.1 hypothetical protein SAMN06265360_12045 [Haloechinothrix alba]
MVEPITASYAEEDEEWTITVAGLGRELTARAPGLIAARDRAEQLIDKLVPDQEERAVVHMLNGSAVDFTAKYMQVRIAGPEAEQAAAPAGEHTGSEGTDDADAGAAEPPATEDGSPQGELSA